MNLLRRNAQRSPLLTNKSTSSSKRVVLVHAEAKRASNLQASSRVRERLATTETELNASTCRFGKSNARNGRIDTDLYSKMIKRNLPVIYHAGSFPMNDEANRELSPLRKHKTTMAKAIRSRALNVPVNAISQRSSVAVIDVRRCIQSLNY